MEKQKRFCIEYEIPPMRGTMQKHFLDDGQDIEDVKAAFLDSAPTAKIRAITKITVETEPDGL